MRALTEKEREALLWATQGVIFDYEDVSPATVETLQALVASGLCSRYEDDDVTFWDPTERGELALRVHAAFARGTAGLV